MRGSLPIQLHVFLLLGYMAVSYCIGDTCFHSMIMNPNKASKEWSAEHLRHVPSFSVCFVLLEMMGLQAIQQETPLRSGYNYQSNPGNFLG